MAGIVDFSQGNWVDTNADGIVDAPPGSVIVNLGANSYYSAFVGPNFNGPSRGGSFGYYPTTVIGSIGGDKIYGYTEADVLLGGEGNDDLTARYGNDLLEGGNGNDILRGSATLVYDNDVLRGGEGNDTIYGAAGNDRIEGGDGDDYITDIGTVLAIDAGTGNDTILIGGPPTGTVKGGSGVDAIGGYVDISDLTVSGVETLLTPDDFALSMLTATRAQLMGFDDVRNIADQGAANPTHTVRLRVTDGGTLDLRSSIAATTPLEIQASDFAVKLYGGSANDSLHGSSGDDVLIGGLGADRLFGGLGDDEYYVDNLLDRPDEFGGKGLDTVHTSISWVLLKFGGGIGFIENLVLMGHEAIDGSGNESNNRIVGNSAANTLAGNSRNDTLEGRGGNDILKGGTEFDVLAGGKGKDDFVFDPYRYDLPSEDTVTDFNHHDDTLSFAGSVFTNLGAAGHSLKSAFFHVGKSAADANDFVIYNPNNGHLSYDANGNGAGEMTLIAVLRNHAMLAANDIDVI